MSQVKYVSHIVFVLSCLILITACSESTDIKKEESATAPSTIEQTNVAIDISRTALKEMDISNRLLLDVRTPEEYENGFIMDAVNIPVAELSEQMDYLSSLTDKSKPIVVYCRSGKRAQAAMEFLSNKGYTNLLHLDGDFGGWETANEEISMNKD